MKNLNLLAAALCTLATVPAFSADMLANRLGVTANALMSNPSATGNDTLANSNTALGGGVFIGIPLAARVELEPGVFYLNRSFNIGPFSYSTQMLQVPVLARVWPVSVFSLGLGAYYSQDVGGLTTGNDLGGIAAAGFDIPIQKTFGFILDGRLSQSFSSNASFADQTWRYRDVQALIGLRFTLGDPYQSQTAPLSSL